MVCSTSLKPVSPSLAYHLFRKALKADVPRGVRRAARDLCSNFRSFLVRFDWVVAFLERFGAGWVGLGEDFGRADFGTGVPLFPLI